ncbi:MAG: uncharacterized protein JWO68_2064 [Actinomycetia bacterium]|nr:uncharacterized protein [Actinomycetes bacterium]
MALAEAIGELVDDRAGLAREALVRARQRTTPLVLARDRSLPVLEALHPLLPDGLRRGSVVGVAGGPGATTLALALAVATSAAGSWTAVVGAPSLGLLAVDELGVTPERLLVVPEPRRESWATVVAALIDAVDLVVLAARRVAPGEVRRLTARAREREAVLVALPPSGWPGADVRLTVGRSTWDGPCGGGAGRLVARRAEVVADGRGAAARQRRATLWLPGPDGRLG